MDIRRIQKENKAGAKVHILLFIIDIRFKKKKSVHM